MWSSNGRRESTLKIKMYITNWKKRKLLTKLMYIFTLSQQNSINNFLHFFPFHTYPGLDGTHDGIVASSANEQFMMMGAGMKDHRDPRPAPPPHTKNLLNLAAGNYPQFVCIV